MPSMPIGNMLLTVAIMGIAFLAEVGMFVLLGIF